MAATVEIDETNTASHTITETLDKCDFGSADQTSKTGGLDPVASPIAQNSSSFSKWMQFHVSAGSGFSAVQNFKVYSSAPASGWSHYTNANTTQATYDTNKALYASPPTPSASDLSGTTLPTAMPTSAPGSANVGIAGTLATTSKITASGARSATTCSDWVGQQLKAATPTVGGSLTITWGYDEVA